MPNSTIEPVRDNGAATDADNCRIQVGSETKCPKSATDDMPVEAVSLVRGEAGPWHQVRQTR